MAQKARSAETVNLEGCVQEAEKELWQKQTLEAKLWSTEWS